MFNRLQNRSTHLQRFASINPEIYNPFSGAQFGAVVAKALQSLGVNVEDFRTYGTKDTMLDIVTSKGSKYSINILGKGSRIAVRVMGESDTYQDAPVAYQDVLMFHFDFLKFAKNLVRVCKRNGIQLI